LSIHTPLEERRKYILERAVPSDCTHYMKVTRDKSYGFQLYYTQTIYFQHQTTKSSKL